MKQPAVNFAFLLGTAVALPVLGWVNVLVWRNIQEQQAAKHYPQVQGVVARSEHKRDGEQYASSVLFTYNFAGREWTKEKTEPETYESAAEARARAHPVGLKVPLLVNPANPAEMLLPAEARGVSGMVLLLPLADLTVVFLLLGSLLEGWTRHAWPQTGGVRLTRPARETRVHLRRPWLDTLQLGLPMLVMPAFAWWVSRTVGFDPDHQGMVSMLSGLGLVLGLRITWATGSRSGFISLQPTTRVLVLPRAGEKRKDLRVNFEEVEAVTVGAVEENESTYYAVSVRPRGQAAVELERWPDEDLAEQFASWLRQQLGLFPSPARD